MTQFVRQELPRVYNLCLRLCQKSTDSEDLCQEVFVRALRGLKNFKGDSSLSTWLHRITINTWKNQVRYESRRFFRRHLSLSQQDGEVPGPGLDLPDPSPGPDQGLFLQEEHRRILTALNSLEKDQKAIVILRDVEEKSYEDIAVIMDLNTGTVKSKLSRARERLREIYYRMGIKRP